jgi:hypothetical protein
MFALASPKLNLARLSLIAAFAVLPLSVEAQDPKRKADYENRLSSVKSLSAALSNDPKAGSPDVKLAMSSVAARQKEAEELAAVGEYETARLILDEGYRLLTKALADMKSGTGYSGPSGGAAAEAGGAASRKPAYERSIASARSLLDAARRANPKAAELVAIEADIGKAEQAAQSGDYVRGEKLANESLNQLRPLLVSMKGAAPGTTATAAGSAAAGEQDQARRLAAFDGRMSSANAMLDAFKRQNQEKAAGKDGAIADIETRLRQAETLRGVDLGAAQGLLDDAYNNTRLGLQSLQTASTMKTGSAALEAGGGAGKADSTRAELERALKSSALLREAVLRQSKAKGVDSSADLARIDTLAGEARSHEVANPARALQSANEANQAAKDALVKLR